MLQFAEALRGLYIADEAEGQGLVEYALIIALVSIMSIAALTALSGGINAAFGRITAAL